MDAVRHESHGPQPPNTLRTFGVAAFLRSHPADGVPSPIPLGPKQLALLAYLACAPDRSATRVRLYSLFAHRTGNGETESAHRDAMRQLMLELRTRLGREALGPPRSDPVRLTLSLTSDRDDLIAAWERHDFAEVVRLYQGEFLPGFEHIGSTEFSHWVEQERADLRRRFGVAARETIATALSATNAPTVMRQALQIARRLREHDPLAQDAWQLILRCLIALGEHEEAVLEGHRLREHLAEQELTADARTRELLALVDAGPGRGAQDERSLGPPEPGEPANGTRVVGRELELSTIALSWDRARTGALTHVHLIAPAGLGKSALLAEARQRLRARAGARRRVRTLQVHAHFASRDTPRALITQVASALARTPGGSGVSQFAAATLVALDHSLIDQYRAAAPPTVVGSAPAATAVADALTELIGAIALDGPLALFLDDLHWGDATSIEVLAESLAACAGLPVLVVSAARTPCSTLCAATGARQLTLAPLDSEAVRELLVRRARLPEEAWGEQLPIALTMSSGGSPLLVSESLQLLAERELLLPSREGWRSRDPDALLAALGDGEATQRRIAQLSFEERAVLLLLAIAGAPMSPGLLRTAAALPLADFNTALATLERRGFAVRQEHSWGVAHSEYARVALDLADQSQLRTARLALGAAVADAAGDDATELRRAGRILAPVGDSSQLARAFERFVRSARRRRDTRPDRALAQEFLGDDAAVGEASGQLVSKLPLLVRARLVTPARLLGATVILALIMAIAGFAASRAMQTPVRADAMLLAIRPSADHSVLEGFDVRLFPESWNGGRSMKIDVSGSATHRLPVGGVGGRALKPDGSGWTVGIPVPDSGVIDLFDVDLEGRATRITHSAGDDYQPSWAPDNSALVFVTSRWSTGGRYNLALLDAASSQVRQLTSGDDTDWEPSWSPDGSRIAFIRQYAASGARGLCVIDANGSHLTCFAPDSASAPALAGWLDARRVLLRRAAGAAHQLVAFDLASRTTESIDESAAGAVISPDGRFAFCQCARDGYPADTWITFPLARPGDFAVLRASSGDSGSTSFEWAPATSRAPYADTVRIELGNGPPQPRAAHQLRAVTVDGNGLPIAAGAIRWQSADSTIATVDSTGLLRARKPGRVTLIASAGGWREGRREITIADMASRVAFEEDWSTALDSNWRAFGIPSPRTVTHALLGNAFLNNGDGAFFSGAYTRRAFPTRDGLWVEATLATPLTAAESQSLVVSLFSIGSAPARAAWRAWDHLSGDGPPGLANPNCSMRYPDGVGGGRIGDELRISTSGGGGLFPAPPSLRTGAPHRLVMQVLPDGRCGVAIDGRVVWVGPATFLESSVHLMLAGNSVDTQMLVGGVRVGTGISEVFAGR